MLLCAYLFFGDFVLLYPVYTLLFADTGLSVWQISSLFVLWCAATIVFEIPSGALADTVSRRRLLISAPLLTAVAFALWVTVPSYWVFAAGFVLWGLRTALTSGALEALVYDELTALGAQGRYAALMGRGEVAGVVGAMMSAVLAAPAISAGGYPAVGAASVMACLAAAVVALWLPEQRTRNRRVQRSWAGHLVAGVGEVRVSAPVRSAVILVAVVTAIWGALDEFTPLLLTESGVRITDLPLLMVPVWAGAAIGGLVAGRCSDLGSRALAGLIACAAAFLIVGAYSGPPGVVALAVAFGLFQLCTIVVDARLQDSIRGDARATVTSVAGMSTDVVNVAVFGGYAALVIPDGHAGAFALLALPYVAVCGWLFRRSRRGGGEEVHQA